LVLNSKNSSKPPSSDPNRKKAAKEPETRRPGGQHGHIGTALKPFPEPDLVKKIRVDKKILPPGKYRSAGYEHRQIVDLAISIFVTEWRAETLEDQNVLPQSEQGKRKKAKQQGQKQEIFWNTCEIMRTKHCDSWWIPMCRSRTTRPKMTCE